MLADDEVGGIVGRANSCTIENCWSSVIIQASTEVGGIVGYAHNSTINNCAAYGPLYTTSDEGEKSGFVGRSNGSTFNNCYYLYGLIDDLYNKTDKDSVFNDCMYFKYDVDGTQKCTLKRPSPSTATPATICSRRSMPGSISRTASFTARGTPPRP